MTLQLGKKQKKNILLEKFWHTLDRISTDTQNFSNRSQQENANWFQWNSKICQLDTLQKLPQWFPIDPNRSTANSSPLWLLPLHLPGFETTGSPLRRSTSVWEASVKGEEAVTLLFVSQLHLKTPRHFWHFFWIHQNYIPVDYTFMLFVSELRLKKNWRHFEEFEKLHPKKKRKKRSKKTIGWLEKIPPSGFQIGNIYIYIYRLIHLSGCSSNRHLSFRGVVVDWFLNSDP